jgi:FAD/FMN-containing dehydrogenase
MTRRDLLKRGAAIAGAALSVPFIHYSFADAGNIDPATVKKFGASLKGRLVLPGDADYEQERRVWNARFDKRPAMIARCASSDDVRRCVAFARGQGMEAAARSGGHSFAGYSTCEGGLVIDLSGMNGLRLDAERGLARAEPGIRIANFDIATDKSGLAASLGACPDVGVGGLTLGGGNGFLESVYGTACDNLTSVEMVMADGELVRCDAEQRPDLYWAMRGAGANFGVATLLEYKLYRVPPFLFGALEYHPAQVHDALRFLNGYVTQAPDELAMLVEIPGQWGDHGMEMAVAYVGDPRKGEPVIKGLQEASKAASSSVQVTPYKDTVGTEAPPGGPFASHRRAGFFNDLTDPVIEAAIEAVRSRPSKWSKVTFYFAHGARCRVDPSATAYSLRHVGFECWVQSYWTEPRAGTKSMEWVESFWKRAGSFSSGRVYVNYLEREGEDRVRAAYGPNYDRLVALKKKYDPTNFFHNNQNIKRAARA